MTSLIMCFIKYVLRIPLRMTDEHLIIGDDAIHGEEAYALFFEGQRSHVKGDYSGSAYPYEASRRGADSGANSGVDIISGESPPNGHVSDGDIDGETDDKISKQA